jgi:hypothetical protein
MSLWKLPRSVGWFLDLNGERKKVHEWNASGTQDDRYGMSYVWVYGAKGHSKGYPAELNGKVGRQLD